MDFYVVELYLLLLYITIILLYQYKYKITSLTKTTLEKQKNLSYLNCAFIFLSLMVMLRDVNIGNDTITYVSSYLRYTQGDTESRMEPGFLIMNKICKFCFESPYSIIVVTGGISMSLYYIFIRKYSNWTFFSVILFVFIGYFDSNMNLIRQSIAVGILCYSYRFLISKNLLGFITSVLIATSFHTTAIIFIFTWFVFRLKISKKSLLIFAILTISIYLFFSIVLSSVLSIIGKYEGYQESSYGEGGKLGSYFAVSIYIVFFIIIYIIYRLVGKIKFQQRRLDSLIMICLMGFGLQIISFNFNIISRIAMYFNIFQILLIPKVLMLLSHKNRIIISTILFTALNLYFWTKITLRPEWNLVYPYKTFLTEIF